MNWKQHECVHEWVEGVLEGTNYKIKYCKKHTYSLGTFFCTTCDNQDHHAKLFSLFQIADLSCETRSMYKLLSSLAYLTVSGKMLKYLCPLGQMAAAFLYYPGYGAINRNKTTMKENCKSMSCIFCGSLG